MVRLPKLRGLMSSYASLCRAPYRTDFVDEAGYVEKCGEVSGWAARVSLRGY
jgi:hypothetical protein